MKNQLILAAVLATFAFAPLAQAADATTTAPVVKSEAAKTPVVKKGDPECRKVAHAEKDGKKPTKAERHAAYKACVSAKKDAKKTEAPAKTGSK